MSLPTQPLFEGTTPTATLNCPYTRPSPVHKVKETHKADVYTDLTTGRKFVNHYEIIDELGRGTDGKVKLARDLETGQNVAIKIIPRFSKKRRLFAISAQDRCKKEISILKKIHHPNIVASFEIIDDPDVKKIYIILEHVELGEVVWRKKGLPHICAYERRRVECEMRDEEERYQHPMEQWQSSRPTPSTFVVKQYSPIDEDEAVELSHTMGNHTANTLSLSSSHSASKAALGPPSRIHSDQLPLLPGVRHPSGAGLEPIPVDHNRVHDLCADEFSYVPSFTIEAARSTFRDTVLGLEYLHFLGVIHRDIKPANLLCTKDFRVKISDFGTSYVGRPICDGESDEAVSIFEAGDLDNDIELAKTVGTPAFFAPELCYTHDPAGPQPKVSEQIDVWSLGVTLYCLIFARIPFMDKDEWQMFKKIATEDVYIPTRRLRPVNPVTKPEKNSLYTEANSASYRDNNEPSYEDIDGQLHDLLRKMLIKDPERRIRLRDVKRHPWVTQGLPDVTGWLEETNPKAHIYGYKTQPD